MVELLVDSGARVGEVCGLRWANVDLANGTATIAGQLRTDPKHGKVTEYAPTERPRSKSTISLHPDTVAALRRHKVQPAGDRLRIGPLWPVEGVGADLVFTWPDGSPLNPKTVSRIVTRLSTEAKLPRLTAHGLRHSGSAGPGPVRGRGGPTGQHGPHGPGGLPARLPGRGRGRGAARRRPLPCRRRGGSVTACDHSVITEQRKGRRPNRTPALTCMLLVGLPGFEPGTS